MRIVYADNDFYINDCVVALGNFDGVHIAHQKLINKCVRIAKENDLKSVVYTFSKHPQEVLGKNVDLLTMNHEKEAIFDKLGVDVLVYQEPDLIFLKISPEEFVKFIINKLQAKAIVVGKDYTFGKNAAGNVELLKAIASRYGVNVNVLPLLEIDGEVVSSSQIRKLIARGDVEDANRFLDRPFVIEGVVKHGAHIGTQMGIPTANINLQKNKTIPEFGVYACKITVDGEEYNGVANIGIKPTFDGTKPLVEVHLLDKNGDFYGKYACVKLLSFIRREIKFENAESLKQQIILDVVKAKEYFLLNT